ncbi:MAG: S1 RNA-binding domain-containing protein, partial [Limisphaerales bacterium]
DGGPAGEILLPGRYIPKNLPKNSSIDVFIYRDSEDRLVATTEHPIAKVGEYASLRVVSINPKAGAFLDWGLPKDLLLPFREQNRPLRVGHNVVVCVCLDPKTDRIIASTRLHQHLPKQKPTRKPGDRVSFLITSRSPLGFSAIVEHNSQGLLYHDNLTTPPQIGQTLQGFVRNVRPDGLLDLSLDAAGYQRVKPLTTQIIEALKKNKGQLNLDDNSPPETIRKIFGVSKKAFKQALGNLYRQRHITFLKPGIQLLNPSDNPSKD